MSGRLRRIAIDTAPLAYPAYRRLFVGQAVSFVGFQVTVSPPTRSAADPLSGRG